MKRMKPRKGLSSSMRAAIYALDDANNITEGDRQAIRRKERELPRPDPTRLSVDDQPFVRNSPQSTWPTDGGCFVELSHDDWQSLRNGRD